MSTSWFPSLRHPSPDDLELWLESNAARGRHLTGVNRLLPVRMKFADSAPTQTRYVLDQRAQPTPSDYFTFRENRGWDLVGSAGDLHVWRRDYTGARPEGFIGGGNLTRRVSAWGTVLGVAALVLLATAVVLGILSGTGSIAEGSPRDAWAPAVAFAVVGVIAGIVALQLRISHVVAARAARTPAPAVESREPAPTA
ncbi:DUF2812 domain-containing protein [Gordonia sp. VNK21]|uniref:DUF2812 domain-containing protein n=1 Tax=Gordonia sp. VNK21 TaxID=3382483 RepID=UPI0038D36DBB